MRVAEPVKNVVIGMILGMSIMLPGVCAATIAVVLGVYDRIIRDISKPSQYLKEDFWFIVTIAVVSIIGVYISVKCLAFVIESYEAPLMLFFATAVGIQIPNIWREADDGEKISVYNILALIVGFVVIMLVFLISIASFDQVSSPGPAVLVLAGAIYGICILSPGLSGSTIIMALGLFAAIVTGLNALDVHVIVPLVIGLAIGIIIFSKVIDHFLTRNRKSSFFAIIGLTTGSVVMVTVQALMKMDGSDTVVQCIFAIAAGIVLGWFAYRMTRRSAQCQVQE